MVDFKGKLDGIRQGCVAVFGTADSQSGTERLIVVAKSRRRTEDKP